MTYFIITLVAVQLILLVQMRRLERQILAFRKDMNFVE